MSLGWGEVSAKEWAELKTKPGADRVPPGDYEVKIEKYVHFEPKDGKIGMHMLVCKTTDKNEIGPGKELNIKFNYMPDPQDDGKRKMNLISQQNAKQLFEATQIPPVTTPAGNVNIAETIKAVAQAQPKIMLLVTDSKDPEYQETKNFRPPLQ